MTEEALQSGAKRQALVASVIQMSSRDDIETNLEVAQGLCEQAVSGGAKLIVLPEKWPFFGLPDQVVKSAFDQKSELFEWMREFTREYQVDLVAGSMSFKGSDDQSKPTNSSFHLNCQGDIESRYDKINMFDATVDGVRYNESKYEQAGSKPVLSIVSAEHGVSDLVIGMAICFDLRFPELFRGYAAAGARVVCLPSAFTQKTTAEHWESLLRARAIESGLFVLAANQWGTHAVSQLGSELKSGGRSMIVDPYGRKLVEASGEGDEVLTATLDFAMQDDVRAALPTAPRER